MGLRLALRTLPRSAARPGRSCLEPLCRRSVLYRSTRRPRRRTRGVPRSRRIRRCWLGLTVVPAVISFVATKTVNGRLSFTCACVNVPDVDENKAGAERREKQRRHQQKRATSHTLNQSDDVKSPSSLISPRARTRSDEVPTRRSLSTVPLVWQRSYLFLRGLRSARAHRGDDPRADLRVFPEATRNHEGAHRPQPDGDHEQTPAGRGRPNVPREGRPYRYRWCPTASRTE